MIDERLSALANRNGVTIVVAPLDGSAPAPEAKGSPYVASIVFDTERARRQRWPAVSANSWSKVADDATRALATRARQDLNDELDAYLSQSFFVAEPFSGRPGETVEIEELHARVSDLLASR
jgi:F0F1-type ATP synthase beta subunit